MVELNYEKNILNCKLTSSDKNYSISLTLCLKIINSRNPNHQGLFNNTMSLHQSFKIIFIKNFFDKIYSIFNNSCTIGLKTTKPLDEPLPIKGLFNSTKSTMDRSHDLGDLNVTNKMNKMNKLRVLGGYHKYVWASPGYHPGIPVWAPQGIITSDVPIEN
jgi:hypothetical protein